jgi:predicted benzoate:H+ symporter BenE
MLCGAYRVWEGGGILTRDALEARRDAGRTSRLDVVIRCAAQPAERPLKRPRFVFSAREVSGAVGDLGTFLPHVLGAVLVAGLSPAGVFSAFGLFYIASGLAFGVPIPVQPMKAASAAVLIQELSPGEVAAGGILIGSFFLLAGLTGLTDLLARVTPRWVVAGIQIGLGLSLARLGMETASSQPFIAVLTAMVLVVLLRQGHLPAALVAVLIGVGAAFATGVNGELPAVNLGVHLPSGEIPNLSDFKTAAYLAALPQVPLTLTNAIIVTAALARQYFPKEDHHVTVKNLSLSTGLANLLAAPLGGYMMCHGAGGLAGHYRFGARTGAACLMIGTFFLLLGILLGDGAFALLALVPAGVVGVLLAFSGLELMWSSAIGRFSPGPAALAIAVGAASFAVNPALGYVVGLLAAGLLFRSAGWAPSEPVSEAPIQDCRYEDPLVAGP